MLLFAPHRRGLIAGGLCASVMGDVALAASSRRASVRLLSWKGTAQVKAGDQTLVLGVDTQVAPFRYARSDTWILKDGEASKRSMVLDQAQGWIIRQGQRSPMPAAMFAHETDQFALYGLMLAALEGDPSVAITTLSGEGRLKRLQAARASAPTTVFWRDAKGRLVRARNSPRPADGGVPLEQTFQFSGEIASNGLRWPRSITIQENGAPYFHLTLSEFRALR